MTNERPIYFSEVASLFKKHQQKILFYGLICFILSLLSLMIVVKPAYRAKATFRQAREKTEEVTTVESMLKSIQGFSEDSSARTVMQSRMLLGKVVEEMGLQVVLKKTKRLKCLFTRKEVPQSIFCSVSYSGEEEKIFFLKSLTETSFVVLDEKKNELCKKEVGIPFQLGEASLCVQHLISHRKPIAFRLLPKREAVDVLAQSLTIKSSKIDSNILTLICKHQNRVLAIGILDALMRHFQNYLKEEHETLAKAQIEYLQKRQDELGEDFERALDNHVAYMEHTLGNEGFLGLSQEIKMLSEPKDLYTTKRHQLDLDAKKWKEEQLHVTCEHPWKEGKKRKLDLDWLQAKIMPNAKGGQIFEGIDLETANKIYIDYNLEKDHLNTKIDQLQAFSEMVKEPDFELGALSTIFEDPASQKLIEKGMELSLKLNDKGEWSEKERRHFQHALEKQKQFIKEHLEKQSALLVAKRGVIEDRMDMLNETALKLIAQEKGIIDEKLGELAKKMEKFPEKWRFENQLTMKKELIMQIIEELTKLSESKAVAHHLFHVESKPLDQADAPLKMHNPHLFVFASMGGIFGAFFSFVFLFIRGMLQGLPISKAYLQDHHFFCLDHQKDTLEKIALTIEKKESVALIGCQCVSKFKSLLGENNTLYECSQGPGSVEALSLIRKADRFILFLNEEKVEILDPYPKEKSICVLIK